ncbi:hypothetical protein SynWH8101_0126 [Synechococcus sp. WH 8101]|uniref:amidohydrolase n=1 Tax=Synechococcus sp. WH 8101 TaxID=59932 RepID=UPI00102393B7|nr:amidohydrolase [Synechococcus sp. WH 8101]QBE67740.1 hypothetical protein SynWH8101_0126 [Synechococcus sp. WH 8101]QNI43936.1 amidohydrolase family protein [Synechococcus sp. WH 8101]
MSINGSRILVAARILTMDPACPIATAVGVNREGRIAAVGDLISCQKQLPDAEVIDLGSDVLLPGFVESHSHPVLSGVATQPPAYWIAPYVGYPTWQSVTDLFEKLQAEAPAGQALLFNGFDKLLHGAPPPTREVLDRYFPDREALVVDNSGHGAYFNSAVIERMGWTKAPPPDPVGGSFGRNPDGTSNGQAFEAPPLMLLMEALMPDLVPHPLASAAQWYALMAGNGITTASEMTYNSTQKQSFETLAQLPHCPLRISLYHVSTAADCAGPWESDVAPEMLCKQGIKLWADGSPWVGNIALTFPYLDTPAVRAAGIQPGVPQEMNYSREQLDQILDQLAGDRLQFDFQGQSTICTQNWQMAIHVNGDAALDVVLDAFEAALQRHNLLGTDHRWRLEHLGAARPDQLRRAAGLGVYASMGPFQFQYWGDLLDGEMFEPEQGSQWCRVKDATEAGLRPSYHNDGSVSPPSPLGNLKTVVTRTTQSGALHGPEQRVSLDQALRAQTIDAAFILGREHDIGSIEVGKLADFVQLDVDPHDVEPMHLEDGITVQATWLGGERLDIAAFERAAGVSDPEPHRHLATAVVRRCC